MSKRPYSPISRPFIILLSLILPILFAWQIAFTTPAAAQSCQSTHTVQSGENLYRIALQYGVNLQELARINGITNFNRVETGQQLCIPINSQANQSNISAQILENNGFSMSQQPVWESTLAGKTTSLAWGDVDNDGDLDLAVGNSNFINTNPQEPELEDAYIGQRNHLYINTNGQLDPVPVWSSEPDSTLSLAWGDMNGDGYLDLAVGNIGQNKVYLNRDGILSDSPDWISTDESRTTSISWGDLNDDAAFDLFAKNEFSPTQIYYNQQTTVLEQDTSSLFSSGESLENTASLNDLSLALLNNDDHEAWGDVNNDQQIDRIITIFGSGLFLQTNPFVDTNIFDDPFEADVTLSASVALADVTGNGRLELTVGEFQGAIKLFSFSETTNEPELLWSTTSPNSIESLAWGDVDGDGDLDLAVGGANMPVRIYENNTNPHPLSISLLEVDPFDPAYLSTFLTFWGDTDSDGYYDLLHSAFDTPLQILRNGFNLAPNTQWQTGQVIGSLGVGNQVKDVSWGDIDNDQDLDLVIGYYLSPNQLFRRMDNGLLQQDNTWRVDDTEATTSVAWGDVDGDGDLDLAVGNLATSAIPKSFGLPPSSGNDQVFINNGGQLSNEPFWQSDDTNSTININWWDYDGDGDLDLIAATDQQPDSDRIYLNEGGKLHQEALFIRHQSRWDGPAFLDIDADGQHDYLQEGTLFLHNHKPIHPQFINQAPLNIAFLQPAKIAPATNPAQGNYDDDGAISFAYQFSGPAQQLHDVFGFYSLDGGQTWRAAQPTDDSETRKLAPGQYNYTWDIFGSGVVGASDHTLFRLQVRPNFEPLTNGIPGLYQRPFAQTETLPFRIRGKQVRVLQDGQPIAGAVVYHQPKSQTGPAPVQSNRFGFPLTTGSNGFLAGRDVLAEEDKLIAMVPVPTDTLSLPFTDSYSFFYTSGTPTESGIDFQTIDSGGVQTLEVSSDNNLLLFHLNVSLEWNGRNDPLFLLELEESFKKASEILYDVTNGQVALGQINLFHNKAYWSQADVVIHADNGLRPSAAIGGVVNRPITETILTENGKESVPNAYVPGQIRMGTVWDPYGERTADLGEDWTRALAHELAHYLLFLPDNYLGFEEGILQIVNCPKSFMTTTTDPAYTEFLTEDGWTGDCEVTLANATTGRTDWETIQVYYPMLSAENVLDGPSNLPLAVTYLVPWAFDVAQTPLLSRNFDLRSAVNQDRIRLGNGQAYLFQINNPDDVTDDVLLPLGAPTGGGDRLKVRGANNGDRLCIFGRNNDQQFSHCESISPTIASLELNLVDSSWQPEIVVQAVTSRTFTINVEQQLNAGESLRVQLFPMHYGSVACNAPEAMMQSRDGFLHTQTLTTRLPAYEVAVYIWAEKGNGRESITTFRLNPPWDDGDETQATIAAKLNCVLPDEELANTYAIDNLVFAPIGGPNNVPVGGPNNVPVGGPNNVPVGGPNNVPVGGPNNVPVGGPNNVPVGGPNNVPVGGGSASFNAPILSADAQVVVYSKENFFAPNGVKSIQLLNLPPSFEAYPWLVPVGKSYRVVLENNAPDRFISVNYLQRDVPEGYEHTITVYFLPTGSDEWQPLVKVDDFAENFVVAPLQTVNGTYTLMATIEMPALEPGWNLLAFPLPHCQSVDEGLVSIIEHVDGIALAQGTSNPPNVPAMLVTTFEPGRVYWVHNSADENIPVIPYFAPPERLPDGSLPECPDVDHGSSGTVSRPFNLWLVGGTAVIFLFGLAIVALILRRRSQSA